MKKIKFYLALFCVPFFADAQIFEDGFEAGNLNKWTLGGGSYTTRAVTTTNPATGTYCYESVGGNGHYNGLEGTFVASQPSEFSWKIKIPSNSGHSAYFVVKDNSSSNGILFAYHRDGTNTYLFYNAGANYEATISFNTWHSFKAANINWTSHTYDLYMDDSLVQSNYAFRENLSNISSVHLYNFTSATAFYDDIDFVSCNLNISSLTSNNNPSSLGCRNCADITVNATGDGALNYVWNTTDTGKVLKACPSTTTNYSVTVTDSVCSKTSSNFTQNVIDARSPYPNRAIMCYNYRRRPMNINVYTSQVQQYLNAGAKCGSCSYYTKRNMDFSFDGIESIYSIYPNPAQNQITTEWFNLFNETVKIELLDMTGRVVKNIFEGDVVEEEMSLINTDISNLPAGMYFMRFSSPTDVRINKVQLMR